MGLKNKRQKKNLKKIKKLKWRKEKFRLPVSNRLKWTFRTKHMHNSGPRLQRLIGIGGWEGQDARCRGESWKLRLDGRLPRGGASFFGWFWKDGWNESFFPVSSQALSGKKREKRAKAGLVPNTSCNVWVFLLESTCLRANCSNTILWSDNRLGTHLFSSPLFSGRKNQWRGDNWFSRLFWLIRILQLCQESGVDWERDQARKKGRGGLGQI